MSSLAQLPAIADPLSLARLQVLLVPVHRDGAAAEQPLTEEVYEHWTKLFRKHQTLRGDEIVHGQLGTAHRRGSSISRAAGSSHVHLAFPGQAPAKHLYPLSLLRMAAFPLIVIGIGMEDEEEAQGYSVDAPQERPPRPSTRNDWAESFAETLETILPPTAAFPLVKRLILVPSYLPSGRTPPRTPVRTSMPGLPAGGQASYIRHAPGEGGDTFIGRLLGEVVGDVFAELGDLATSLESPAGMRTLAGTLLPSLTTLSEPMTEEAPNGSRASSVSGSRPSSVLQRSTSVASISSAAGGRALTPGGRPTSVQGPSAPPIQTSAIAPAPSPPASMSSNPFRRSTVLSNAFNRSASGSNTPTLRDSRDGGVVAKYTSAPLVGIAGGRLLKLLGDMYLLTGMYSDAIKCFDDGAERSRAVGDVLWECLAREGRAVAGIGEAWQGRDGSTQSSPFPSSPIPVEVLSHFLSSLACLSRAPIPFPQTILAPSPQSARDSVSLPKSAGPVVSQVGTGEGLLSYLYSSLCLRISHFVLIIFAAGGWGSIAVSCLMSHSLPRTFPPLIDTSDLGRIRSRRQMLAQLASQSQITRTTILGHVESAAGPFRLAMTKAEQLAVFVEVARVARLMDMQRREAAATRQIVKLLTAVLTEGRDEQRRLTSRAAAAARANEGSKAGAHLGLGLGMPVSVPHPVAVRRRESSDGNSAVMDLIARICTVLDVDLLGMDGENDKAIVLSGRLASEPHFGWPEMQVETIKEAIAAAEALPDQTAVIKLCLSALKSLHVYLNPANQNQLAKLYPQALSTIRRRAIDSNGIPWWIPGRLVLSVEIASLAPNRVPFEHSRSEIARTETGSKKDPFLYNPRLKVPEAGKTVLVANEQVDVYVTLRNVFAFDIDVQDLSLLTSGAPLITNPLPLLLPASAVHTVRVTGLAPAPGWLEIRGVAIRLVDGSSAEFLIPVEDVRDKKRVSAANEAGKTKRSGLEARKSMVLPSEMLPALPTEPEKHKWLECNVVEEQPVLWIKKTSLSHGTVMLYDGETSVIRITLENSSPVPVDFVKLSFDDSVTRDSQSMLSDGDMSAEQAYELQYDMSQRPVFSWDSTTPLVIPPGGRATISVQVLGKVECTDGSVRIDYGYVGRDEQGSVFHTRRLTFPVLFTVYRTLECYSMDVASLPSGKVKTNALERLNGMAHPSAFATSADDELRRVLGQNDERSVLFCLNVCNVFSVPFEVAMSTNSEESEEKLVITRLVPPGATERLVFPIKRQHLSLEERSKPIPSSRQYVVDKTRKSADEIQRDRESFWFRERLLSMVNVSWREPGSLRSGTLALREQTFTLGHLANFRQDEVAVSLSVEPRSGDAMQAMDFVDIRITVVNNLERPSRPYVRLEARPANSTDSWSLPAPPAAPRRISSLPATPVPIPKTVAFDGILATTLPLLQPGESGTHTVGAVLLASGSYTFRAAAEEVSEQQAAPPSISFSPSVTVDVA